MLVAFLIVLALLVLYLLALQGRTQHPLLRKLRKWKYAHRGLHGEKAPENSMAAFRLAVDHGFGMELDVHLMADGELAVLHDSSLMRMTNADVRIEDLTAEQLQNYRLAGTDESIPTFRQVLELVNGKVPLIVELKSVDNNYATLAQSACRLLDDYKGLYCIESFDPRCIRWLKINRPEIVRGQLAHNSLREKEGNVPLILRFCMTNLLSNFWNRPDFIAYRFVDRMGLSVRLCRKLWKVQGVSWTLRSQTELDTAISENWIPIFEGFRP